MGWGSAYVLRFLRSLDAISSRQDPWELPAGLDIHIIVNANALEHGRCDHEPLGFAPVSEDPKGGR